ncbi:MAG TPA: hypothetical protein VNU71_02035, partial [Burkholderiaceae bacterium]|nr:hypothetical protein [Burkholderiaceae bacterium]
VPGRADLDEPDPGVCGGACARAAEVVLSDFLSTENTKGTKEHKGIQKAFFSLVTFESLVFFVLRK